MVRLTDVLLRFRQFQYVLFCDIKIMFLGIRVAPEDQKYMRIFYCASPSDILTILVSSPFTCYEDSSPPWAIFRGQVFHHTQIYQRKYHQGWCPQAVFNEMGLEPHKSSSNHEKNHRRHPIGEASKRSNTQCTILRSPCTLQYLVPYQYIPLSSIPSFYSLYLVTLESIITSLRLDSSLPTHSNRTLHGVMNIKNWGIKD